MDIKISRLRNDLRSIRNQRETANAAHHDEIRKRKCLVQWLQDKILSLERKGVLPHETKSALDRVYGSDTTKPHLRPLQYVVRQEAIWLATTSNLERLTNAEHLLHSMNTQIHKSMQCELRFMKEERAQLLIGFDHTRNTILEEKEAIRIKCNTILLHQRDQLEMLDPSRCLVADTTTPTKKSNFFENLVAGTSPMSLFKRHTSNIFQITPRTA